jgi:hypothetical protein
MRTFATLALLLSLTTVANAAPRHTRPKATMTAALVEAQGDVRLAKARLATTKALVAAEKARAKSERADAKLAKAQAFEHCVADGNDDDTCDALKHEAE